MENRSENRKLLYVIRFSGETRFTRTGNTHESFSLHYHSMQSKEVCSLFHSRPVMIRQTKYFRYSLPANIHKTLRPNFIEPIQKLTIISRPQASFGGFSSYRRRTVPLPSPAMLCSPRNTSDLRFHERTQQSGFANHSRHAYKHNTHAPKIKVQRA